MTSHHWNYMGKKRLKNVLFVGPSRRHHHHHQFFPIGCFDYKNVIPSFIRHSLVLYHRADGRCKVFWPPVDTRSPRQPFRNEATTLMWATEPSIPSPGSLSQHRHSLIS